jgi:hypothetical protein
VHASGDALADLQSSTVVVVEHASAGSMRDYVHSAMTKSRDRKGARAYSYCDALRWALQASKGLQYLHGHRPTPLLHGAVSLDNVMLKGRWARLLGMAWARMLGPGPAAPGLHVLLSGLLLRGCSPV